ncbi:MAG: FGGY-family carbohydrate kinase [Granulosicoccus sp.]|nr:FGGY-family carbohydrate kinase [Granulosicoccus sp.]
MSEALVIGLDSSTQSTKAIAWNIAGKDIATGRSDIPMQNPRLDCFEQNPADWWESCISSLSECVAQLRDNGIDASAIQGLSISNQRETVGFIGGDGTPAYPAMVWLDERSREQVSTVAKHLGAENIHRITGRPPDVTPCLYRFAWMKENEPKAWNDTACFVDVQAYLVQKLCGGDYRTGWISADPMGLMDLEKKTWSQPILDYLELDVSRLPDVHPPGTLLGELNQASAELTGLPVGLPVFAAGGDGQCAGLGTDCTTSERAYINLGTAVVSGVWAPDYRYNPAWRTELAAQGEGYIFETCLRSGAFLLNWFVDQFVAQGKADASTFDRLEKAAMQLPIGSEGLLVQPYFSGVMDPHWDASARGVMLGLSGSHNEIHIYRAIIEAMTLDQVMSTEEVEVALGHKIDHYLAIGGGANSKLWCEMLADASGKPVKVSSTVEASALGAGMIAAFGAGWFSSITSAAEGMSGETTVVEPNVERFDRYRELLAIYRKVYQATAQINHELVAFAADKNFKG